MVPAVMMAPVPVVMVAPAVVAAMMAPAAVMMMMVPSPTAVMAVAPAVVMAVLHLDHPGLGHGSRAGCEGRRLGRTGGEETARHQGRCREEPPAGLHGIAHRQHVRLRWFRRIAAGMAALWDRRAERVVRPRVGPVQA